MSQFLLDLSHPIQVSLFLVFPDICVTHRVKTILKYTTKVRVIFEACDQSNENGASEVVIWPQLVAGGHTGLSTLSFAPFVYPGRDIGEGEEGLLQHKVRTDI